jgi:hypothetical protein
MNKLIQPLSEDFLYRSPESMNKSYYRLLVPLRPRAEALSRDRQRQERRYVRPKLK